MGTFLTLLFILAIYLVVKFFKWMIRVDRESLAEYRQKKEAEETAKALAEANRLKLILEQRDELRYQATLVGDEYTVKMLDEGQTEGLQLPEKRNDGAYLSMYDQLRIFKIAGINRRGDLSSYIGDFNGVLVGEPTNEYDPMAIMVKCDDGKHLGYIREDQTEMVRSLMKAGDTFKPYRITGRIRTFVDEDGKERYDGVVYILGKA